MTAASVRLSGVSKQYDGRTVLDAIDLDIADGELVALLGPSGCGKTTTLRVIAGFERPDSGTLMIGNRDATRLPVSRRGIGIVFQAYSLFPHLSAIENVAYGLEVRRVSRARRRERAQELLEAVGLAEHGAKFPGQLSGGQQQRVALARALAIEPSVLLLDEPLSALDAKVRVQLREEIRRIQQQMGTTTVIVTHDQEEALTMADRVAVMQAGRIEQIGTPPEVYRRPATAFVSSFVGNVNRIPAHLQYRGVAEVFDQALSTSAQGALGRRIALIRPEDVHVEADPEGTAVVASVTFRGPVGSVHVAHADIVAPIRVDLPSRAAMQFVEGNRVRLRVITDDVVLEESAVDE